MEVAKRPSEFAYQSKHTLAVGDRIMLCSDGVSDLLPKAKIEAILSQAASPEAAVRLLVMSALEMGGKDNTTAMVLEVK